jgi:hypothetical protein
LRCWRPGREELTDGLDELISAGAGSPGAARTGQQSAPGIRAVAAAVAGGDSAGQRDGSLQIARLRVRGGECGPGRLRWRANRADGAVQTGRPGQLRQSPLLIAFSQQDPGMFSRSAAAAADRAEACLFRVSAASR